MPKLMNKMYTQTEEVAFIIFFNQLDVINQELEKDWKNVYAVHPSLLMQNCSWTVFNFQEAKILPF